MSLYMKRGNTYRVTSKEAMDITDFLPAGTYVVKMDPFDELYLEEMESFEISGKIYGAAPKQADRILNTYQERENSTGVMLTGEKGSGKTMLAKLLAMKAKEKNIPTVIVNSPFYGDKFNTLIQSIEQECIILFDEFEKVYKKEEQEFVLTLMDGVYPSKKLFIITCNDKYRVDQHMRNRPGRIFYLIEYKGLEHDFITEYCNDNLINKEYTAKICRLTSFFDAFNFDMLKALVEEMNRYNETPQEALSMLNAKPEFSSGSAYTVIIKKNGAIVDSQTSWEGNPINAPEFHVSCKTSNDNDGDEWGYEYFGTAQITKVDSEKGTFEYVNKNGFTLILTRKIEKTYNYMAL